ncbi:transcriptional regulator FeaR [Gordonia sinesedis]
MRRTAYVDVESDPTVDDFYGDVRLGKYTNFSLSTKRAAGEQVRRDRRRIAQGREDDEYLFVTFQTRGTCIVEQAGHTAVVPPDSLVIYDSALPFEIHADGPYEQVRLEVPAAPAFALAGIERTTDILATTISCSGVMSAVAAFFTRLADIQDSDPVAAARLEPHATSLATSLLSLVTPVRSAGEVPNDLRREQVLAYMRAHLDDPDLDADQIATAMRLSRRSLYRLFEGTDRTLMGHLRSARIDAAANLLRKYPSRPVSLIARHAGFTDPRSFYRTFRDLTDTTPSEYRERPG